MTGAQLIGGTILAAIFCGAFAGMSRISGWRVAAAIWTGSLAVTGLILAAVMLLTGEWTP